MSLLSLSSFLSLFRSWFRVDVVLLFVFERECCLWSRFHPPRLCPGCVTQEGRSSDGDRRGEGRGEWGKRSRHVEFVKLRRLDGRPRPAYLPKRKQD